MAESRLLTYARGLLAFTAACLPLYAARFHYGPLPTTLLENLILGTIAVYLVARWREHRLRLVRTPYDIPIVLLLVAGAISVAVASDHRAALGLYRAYFIEPVAIFYVAVDLFARVTDVKILLTGLGIGTTVFAALNLGALAIAIAQHAVKLGAPPSAIYTSSNEVAMFLEPPFAMATALLLYGESGRQRRWVLVWWLFVTASLLLTFSRGALGALAVYMLFTIVSAKPELRRPLIVVGIAVVVVAAIGLVVAANTPLVETRFSFIGLHFAWNGRTNIYVHTIETIVQHPIFGVGLGNFVFISHRRPLIYPHDLYLSLWVEIGLLGLVAFLWIMLRLLFETYRAFRSAMGFEKALLWGVAGALLMWAAHGIVDTPYFKNDMSAEFWIFAAIGAIAAEATTRPRPLAAVVR